MSSLDDLKNTIKEIAISQVIEAYVSVVKKGATVTCVCPFHDDHNPSLSIHDGKGIFKCFVCGASGDSIGFVTRLRGLDFIEGLKDIAEKFSIPTDALERKTKDPRREMAEKLILIATQIYEKHAANPASEPAQTFFTERKIKPESVKKFRLGYCPPNHSFKFYLQSLPKEKQDFAFQIAFEIGLVGKSKKNGSYYDTFTNRIIFPLWDPYGTIVGFSSRTLRPDLDKRKYLNSKESFIFHKKNILYGMNFAKNEIRSQDRVILVEGQMDVIALSQNDFPTAVACSGISLDPKMRDYILKMTKNVYLCLDADQAGLIASRRISDLFLESGVIAKHIAFLKHKDVDEFLVDQGGLLFAELVENASTFVDFELEKLSQEIPQSIERKLDSLEKAFELLKPLGSHLFANEKLISFAKRLGLKSAPEEITKNFQTFLSNQKSPRVPIPPARPEPEPEVMPEEPKINVPNLNWTLCANERYLLEAILTLPAVLNHDKFLELLDFVEHHEVRQLICELKESKNNFSEKQNLQQALNEIISNNPSSNDELRTFFEKRSFMFTAEESESMSSDKLIFDLSKRLKTNSLLRQRDQLSFNQEITDDPVILEAALGKRLEIEKLLNLIKKEKFIP